MPCPSVPGSHAATNASDAFSSLLTHIGLPDINTDTTGIFCCFNAFKILSERLLPRSNSRLSLSPCPSAYGSSPNTTMATSGLVSNVPFGLKIALPPAVSICAFNPAYIEVAPGKSSFLLLVPCHVMLQPPDCLPILLAASPAISILLDGLIGNIWLLFLSRTKDSCTAWRAISRCAGAPISANLPENLRLAGLGFSNKPARNLTRKIRATASSILAIGIVPAFTCAIVLL